MNKQKKINLASAWEKVGMPFVLLVLIIFMLINAPNFGTVSNLFNVARSISISAILAAGMTLVIITTGIDLSVGSTIAVSGCVAVLAARAGLNPILAVILGMFIGAVIVLSFILLMVVFRSVLVPLKAAVMNILSISAAYGVIVLAFQTETGASLLGVDSGVPIMSAISDWEKPPKYASSMTFCWSPGSSASAARTSATLSSS